MNQYSISPFFLLGALITSFIIPLVVTFPAPYILAVSSIYGMTTMMLLIARIVEYIIDSSKKS